MHLTAPLGRASGAGLLVALGAAVTVGVLPVFLVAGLAVQVRAELGFSVTLLGVAGSAFFVTAALAARPLVGVTDLVGPTAAMRIAVVGSAGCLAALALAPSTGWLLAGLCAAGLPNALAQPASNEIIMACVPEHRRGIAFAVKQSAIPGATMVAGAAVPLLALTVGWRAVFALAGLVGLLAVLVVPRTDPRARRPRRSGAASSRPATSGLLVALAAVTGLGSAAAGAMATFVTTAAVEAGFGLGVAGLMLSVGSIAGLVVRLGAGWWADRRPGPDLLRTVVLMLGLGSVGLGSVGLALLATGSAVLFLVGLLLGFGAGWAWPGIFNFAVASRHADRVAHATSVTQTGVYLGAGAGPALFGLVAGTAGIVAAWLSAAVLMAVAMLLLIAVRGLLGRRRGSLDDPVSDGAAPRPADGTGPVDR